MWEVGLGEDLARDLKEAFRDAAKNHVSNIELSEIRALDDFDLRMLVAEIADHGWQVARKTLRMMHENQVRQALGDHWKAEIK